MRVFVAILMAFLMSAPLLGCESIPPESKGGDGGGSVAPVAAPITDTTGSGSGAGAGTDLTDTTSASLAQTVGISHTGESDASGELVARVNGDGIPLSEFQRQAFDTQRYYVNQEGVDPNSADGQRQLLYLRRQVLDDMINQKLIEQTAVKLNLQVTDAEVEQSMAQTVQDLGGIDKLNESITQTGATTEELRSMERSSLIGKKVLDAITNVPATAEFRHARHILCKTEADCQAALGRLNAGETFEAVAKSASIDEATKDRGGDLDWVARGMLPSKELETAIFSLKAGERSPVVQSSFGFHVIEVSEIDPARPLLEAQQYKMREKELLDWFAAQRKTANIEIFVADLKAIEKP